ncbi:MAG: DNA repair protein RadC [Peptostreptococcales bacterium]
MYLDSGIKGMPLEERPREKLAMLGVHALSNAELLAIILRSGTREMSAIELSNRILSMDKDGLSFLTHVSLEELKNIQGIGDAKACQILASIEIGKRIATRPKGKKINVSSPRDVADLFMEEMRYYKKEYFKVLLLNTKNEIIMIDDISIGSLNSTIVHPREVFVNAIKRSSSSVILIHNHPSGNPKPSAEDIEITKRLYEAGKIIGIDVLDHLIIGDGVYLSLKEELILN